MCSRAVSAFIIIVFLSFIFSCSKPPSNVETTSTPTPSPQVPTPPPPPAPVVKDSARFLVSISTGRVVRANFFYDDNNKMVRIKRPQEASAELVEDETEFKYENGRVGSIVTKRSTSYEPAIFQYDNAGNWIKILYKPAKNNLPLSDPYFSQPGVGEVTKYDSIVFSQGRITEYIQRGVTDGKSYLTVRVRYLYANAGDTMPNQISYASYNGGAAQLPYQEDLLKITPNNIDNPLFQDVKYSMCTYMLKQQTQISGVYLPVMPGNANTKLVHFLGLLPKHFSRYSFHNLWTTNSTNTGSYSFNYTKDSSMLRVSGSFDELEFYFEKRPISK